MMEDVGWIRLKWSGGRNLGGGVRLGYWTRLYVSQSGLAPVGEFRVCLVGGFLSNFGVTTNTGGVRVQLFKNLKY